MFEPRTAEVERKVCANASAWSPSFKAALVVAGLPQTRSGKILRGTMRRIADGEDYVLPATIEDPAVLGEIDAALARAGYALKPMQSARN
jgi:hypothetical protein